MAKEYAYASKRLGGWLKKGIRIPSLAETCVMEMISTAYQIMLANIPLHPRSMNDVYSLANIRQQINVLFRAWGI
jgi:hypothetical protein